MLSIAATSQSGGVVSAGDNTHTEQAIVNWSIGSVIAGSAKTKKHIVTQGMTSDVYKIVYENKVGHLNIKCYPNPAVDQFILELLSNEPQQYRWVLFGANGEKVSGKQATTDLIPIDISSLQSSLYFLSVFDKDGRQVAQAKLLKK